MRVGPIAVSIILRECLSSMRDSRVEVSGGASLGAECIRKRLRDLHLRIGCFPLAEGHAPAVHRVGVRDVEVVSQLARARVSEDGYAHGPAPHAAVEQPLPAVEVEDGRGIGPLRVDESLLVERQLIVPGR